MNRDVGPVESACQTVLDSESQNSSEPVQLILSVFPILKIIVK